MRHQFGIERKELVEMSPAIIHGNKATVSCVERHHRADGKESAIYREYSLIREHGEWRILRYENKTPS